ncbi:MAG: universal stress protein [Burkholderiales bacterium]
MTYKRILVPVDGSPTSAAGLKEALKLAKDQRAKLRLLHVIDELIVFNTPETAVNIEPIIEELKRGGERVLQAAGRLALAKGIRPESDLRESAGVRVSEVIGAQARRWRADLIVMGTHGRRGVNRMLMGSDAELVVRNASTPVLLVPAGAGAPNAARRSKRAGKSKRK